MYHGGSWISPRMRPLLAAIFLSAVGSGLTLPYLIVYLHHVRHFSLVEAGSILAFAGVVGVLVGVLGGSFIDKVGSLQVLIAGIALDAASAALLPSIRTLWEALAIVGIQGAGGSLAWPAQHALVSVVVQEEERPKSYSWSFATLNLGLGIGGLMSGTLVRLNSVSSFTLIYRLDSLSFLVAGMFAFFGMRRAAGGAKEGSGGSTASSSPASLSGGYREAISDKSLVVYLACSFALILFGYSQLEAGWTAFVTEKVGATPTVVGIAFAANCSVIVSLQFSVTRLVVRMRRSRALALTASIWVLCFSLSGLAAQPWCPRPVASILLVVALGLFGLGETFYFPVGNSIVNALAPAQLRGHYNALASNVWSVGILTGAPLAGMLLSIASPLAWTGVVSLGCGLTVVGIFALGRMLPSSIEMPL